MRDTVNDPLLLAYLMATTDEAEAAALTELFSAHIGTLVDRIVRAQYGVSLRSDDQQPRNVVALDVAADARAAVVAALSALKESPRARAIANVLGYATQVTRHACAEEARRRSQGRARLKNRVRYFLTTQRGFGLWTGPDGDLVAGRSAESGQAPIAEGSALDARVRPALDDLEPASGARRLAEQVAAILTAVGAPLRLDALVAFLADHLGIVDDPCAAGQASLVAPANVVTPEPDVLTRLAGRSVLERTWEEVCTLPLGQRTALLLGLRSHDGEEGLSLFVATGVATMHDIAALLHIPAPELAGLADELPLDDATIGRRLGLARQQVINLRKAGRARLTRRLTAFWGQP